MPNMSILLSREGVKVIGVAKSNVFKEFVMTLLASTRVLHKVFFLFLSYFTFFLDVKYILDNCRSQGLPLEE